MDLIFEWDKSKAESNLRKHKVSFDEAATIFQDRRALTFLDTSHSIQEQRFISIGLSSGGRILLVVHTENEVRGDVIVIRIISSRKATKLERVTYEIGE